LHPANEHPFPKMTVKYRKQLVAMDCSVDFSKRGEAISPKEWKKKLEEKDERTLILDVRNTYESKVGHFEGAELPDLEQFRHFPEYAKKLKDLHGADAPVMMYCTGGIRCEYYSALLKEEGFEKVYQLDGGVIQYGLEEGSKYWKGKLFVFDDRLVVPLDQEGEVIATCRHCQNSCDVYHNCANMDCNELFICCIHCLKEHVGCCSEECKSGRVRPYHEDGKPFRKMRSN
ncbi:MAG TPA: rhodanese-like domain-containing protein, partial [Chlamydiales bacterium]|nr:rhodanese-like domain-containing protein [Chlamydiales bacterium]